MKRFTVVTSLFSVCVLAAWVIFQPSVASLPKTNRDNSPIEVQDVSNELMKAITSGNEAAVPMTSAEARTIAPVFDSTGAVVSDPTGTLLRGNYSADAKIAPMFDTTGMVVSDPTGTILSAIQPEDMAVPVMAADVKIAPVYDATGALVSDPTGTIWNTIHP